MKKIVIYHVPAYDVPLNVKQQLECRQDITIVSSSDRTIIMKELVDAEILFTFQFDNEMLDQAPQLKWVHSFSAGVDSMPLQRMKEKGILLNNVKGMHKGHIAEYAIAAMINLARNWHFMFRNQVEKVWDRSVEQDEISGKTLAILGVGQIGSELAKKAKGMGMTVIGMATTKERQENLDAVYLQDEITTIFNQSDYVVNLLPSTPKTEKLINREAFNAMNTSACFINIGRGTTVDESDLIEALSNGNIRAMVSDVFETEPLPEDHPFWKMDNVIITPHICGDNKRYLEKAFEIVLHNLEIYLSGKGTMLNRIDLDKGY